MVKTMRKIAQYLWLLPRTFAIMVIAIYQRTLSPDHGMMKVFYPYGFCPKHPTCSESAKIDFAERGFCAGIFLTSIRLLQCSPWNRHLSDAKLFHVVSSQAVR